MSSLRTEAIVLRAVDYGETDRIVHLLTAETGRLTAIAKAARRSQRRFPGTLDVFNHLEIEARCRPRTAMAFLEKARLVDPFLGLRRSPMRYAMASFLTEMLDRLSPEGLEAKDAARLFDFAVESLSLLESVRPDRALRVMLELRALDALGLRPELGRCVRCGRVPAAQIAAEHRVGFYVPDGGIVCSSCGRALDGLVAVELGTLRLLEEGMGAPPEALPRIRVAGRALAQAERLVFRFQRFHVGVELRSERFLKESLGAGAGDPA
jgi:DNA repair protein RecO (recombination protein O)